MSLKGEPVGPSLFVLEERAAADAEGGPEHGWKANDLVGTDVLEDAVARARAWCAVDYGELGDVEVRVVEYTRRRVARIVRR